jgi:deoxycytidylate deaminase
MGIRGVTTRYQRFARVALALAAEIDHDMTHQLCALVVKRNRVLSVGYNSNKTHPMMSTNMQQLHAECSAILKCPDGDLRGSDVVVARARAEGKAGLAKPCAVCEGILRRCGVRRVFYTTNWDDDCPEIEEIRL